MSSSNDWFGLDVGVRRRFVDRWRDLRWALRGRRGGALVAVLLLLAGAGAAAWLGPVRSAVERAEARVAAAERAAERLRGENALLGMQVERLREVQAYSARYGIGVGLAEAIYDIALAERLDPELAFRLVQTESSFRQRAVSDVGAVGYTQLLPTTASWLDPEVDEPRLFERDVNLRLGFRYLALLLERYDGDERLALLAYNRGPNRVGTIVARGGDPANGYASRILGD